MPVLLSATSTSIGALRRAGGIFAEARSAAAQHMGGVMVEADEQRPIPGSVGIGRANLGLTTWTMGLSMIVSVSGEVDIATADQLSEALGAALSCAPEGLICDLSGVEFLGATCLTALLVARRRAIASGTGFDLVCPQPRARRVFALVGLDAVFDIHDRTEEAVAAQAGRLRQLPLAP